MKDEYEWNVWLGVAGDADMQPFMTVVSKYAPNAFYRMMQRMLLGVKWTRINK